MSILIFDANCRARQEKDKLSEKNSFIIGNHSSKIPRWLPNMKILYLSLQLKILTNSVTIQGCTGLEIYQILDTRYQLGNVFKIWLDQDTARWYGGGYSTTAEEVSKFQRLFPNPNWLVWGRHPATKNSLPCVDYWLMAIFPLVVELTLVKCRQRFGCLFWGKHPTPA